MTLLLLLAVGVVGLLVARPRGPVDVRVVPPALPAAGSGVKSAYLDTMTEIIGGVRWLLPPVAATSVAELTFCQAVKGPPPTGMPAASTFQITNDWPTGAVTARALVEALVDRGFTVLADWRITVPGLSGATIAAVAEHDVNEYAAKGTGWSVLASPLKRESVGWGFPRRARF